MLSLLTPTTRDDKVNTMTTNTPDTAKILDRISEMEEKYAILDDDTDMLPEQFPNFFKTSWEVGVTPEIIEKVRKHFEK